ncbi:MAG: caspase family protein [Leptolyngbyaceae cyanobacterium SM1_4_3]|nr:caspase family protein [Leptolyngbyaceae cyanobacterium SM1_4_3]
MSTSSTVLIDFSEAGLDLDRADLEDFLLNVANEMRSGDLVQEAQLARETDVPEAAKSGAAAFLVGILTAEINRENLGKVMDYLGNLRYGKTLALSGEIDGMTYNIEYRNNRNSIRRQTRSSAWQICGLKSWNKKNQLNRKTPFIRNLQWENDALLIGVGEYGEGLTPLPAAPKDVAAFAEVLRNPQMCGFDEVKSVINPNQAEMAREIELWFQGRKPDDLVLLFFSGHGVKDDRRELYFAACNTEKRQDYLVRATAISAQSVLNCIRWCKAKSQIII